MVENNNEKLTKDNVQEEVDNAITQEPAGAVQSGQEEATQETEDQSEGPEQEATGSVKPEQSDSRRDEEYSKHVQNWRALREAREKAERERDEALSQLRQQGDNRQSKQESAESTLGDDDLIEGKHFKQGQQQVNQRIAQLETQLIEAKIKGAYPDFDKIVNKDTLGMLRDTDPELAESLALNPNLYSQAVAAYKSIKRYGLAGPDYSQEKEKVNSNITKPRTVTSLAPQQGESPLSRANAFASGLTDDLKEQLWKEMQDIAKHG